MTKAGQLVSSEPSLKGASLKSFSFPHNWSLGLFRRREGKAGWKHRHAVGTCCDSKGELGYRGLVDVVGVVGKALVVATFITAVLPASSSPSGEVAIIITTGSAAGFWTVPAAPVGLHASADSL